MMLRKLSKITAAVLLVSATSTLAVWAHWPAATARESAIGRGQVPAIAPETPGVPAHDAGPPPAKRSTKSGGDVRVAECPAPCLPDYCPLSIAANVVSRVFGHLHPSGATSR